MTSWLIALAAGILVALLQYATLRAPSPPRRLGLATLRAAAIALVLALALDAPLGRAVPVQPSVFVDASLSMTREGATLARAAWDSARAAGGDSIWSFGDSVRPARGADAQPADASTQVRPVVERTMATGRPAVLVTDGEVQDSNSLDGLATGSRIIVIGRDARRDAAVMAMDAPRAAVEGDSIAARVTIAAGAQGASPGAVTLFLDQQQIGRWPLDAMSPWSERQLDLRVRATSGGVASGVRVLRAIVATADDAERRNDTLSSAIEVSRAASAVFVSTSPDQDARFSIAVLRGALALPTRGFLRIAPGMWRVEGTLAPVTEDDVRRALRDAPVAILHGDTAIFGPPRDATLGPLALLVPPETDDGEWYPSATPASPLSGALAAVPLESLPPVSVGVQGEGEWVALEARRGRETVRRPVVVGRDTPRRVITVSGSGFWRWRFRAGASADAYAALWGGIFDWLAAERSDRRGAVPDEGAIRSGQPVRWRRGSSTDSTVFVSMRLRAPGSRPDTLRLRFASGVSVQETRPLPPGIYDIEVPNGRTVLAVNPSAELLPTRPRLQSSSVGRRARSDDARGARTNGWLYAIVIALLCVEWVLRRRLGLR